MKEHYVEVGLPWFTTLSLPDNTDIVVVLRLLECDKLSVVVSNDSESAGRFARPSTAQFSSKRDDLSLAVSRLRAPLSTVTRSNAAAVCGGQWFLNDTTLKNRLRRPRVLRPGNPGPVPGLLVQPQAAKKKKTPLEQGLRTQN